MLCSKYVNVNYLHLHMFTCYLYFIGTDYLNFWNTPLMTFKDKFSSALARWPRQQQRYMEYYSISQPTYVVWLTPLEVTTHVCMCVCMYVCLYVYLSMCVCVSMEFSLSPIKFFASALVCVCKCVYVRARECACVLRHSRDVLIAAPVTVADIKQTL